MPSEAESPADQAGRVALEKMFSCIDEGRSFRLEAGAGAGKTYSLDKALRHLIEHRGQELQRSGQQVGCITYTNVAKDEIISRIQAHPSVRPETIHGFCWSLLKSFQPTLRTLVPELDGWAARLEPTGGIGTRSVEYELGFPSVGDYQITLRHEDVLALMVRALDYSKFRAIFTARYPILLIDEYQDTDANFIDAIKKWFLDTGDGPQLGFFGDHWQKIYGNGCGLLEHEALEVIEKHANFRSTDSVVQVLNRMRPDLPQIPRDTGMPGEARVFHTNLWQGERMTGKGGGHWTGDTSREAAKAYFVHTKQMLADEGWNFVAGETKVLMLSHNVLAHEQGYSSIPPIYGYSGPWLKKEDPHIKFLADHLEPACSAFLAKRYGEMHECFGVNAPKIQKHSDKAPWMQAMTTLVALRTAGTIGEVVDFIGAQPNLRYPASVEEAERRLAAVGPEPVEGEPKRVAQLRKLRAVPYTELIALDQFIDGHTPFATKHGVKGAEFENVLVIVGRGWNKYNFGQMLEWIGNGPPADKAPRFESNRNLLYVACSRPKTRLALLFTQLLSADAMTQISGWFGAENVVALPADPG